MNLKMFLPVVFLFALVIALCGDFGSFLILGSATLAVFGPLAYWSRRRLMSRARLYFDLNPFVVKDPLLMLQEVQRGLRMIQKEMDMLSADLIRCARRPHSNGIWISELIVLRDRFYRREDDYLRAYELGKWLCRWRGVTLPPLHH